MGSHGLLVPGSVLVAVRARPLNDREKAEKSSECLTFQDQHRGDFQQFQGMFCRTKSVQKMEFSGCGIFWRYISGWKCWVNIPNEIAIFHREIGSWKPLGCTGCAKLQPESIVFFSGGCSILIQANPQKWTCCAPHPHCWCNKKRGPIFCSDNVI